MLTVLPEVIVEGVGGVVYGRLGVRHPRPERLESVLPEGEVRLLLIGDEGGQRLPDVVLLALERAKVRAVLRGGRGVEFKHTQTRRATIVSQRQTNNLNSWMYQDCDVPDDPACSVSWPQGEKQDTVLLVVTSRASAARTAPTCQVLSAIECLIFVCWAIRFF